MSAKSYRNKVAEPLVQKLKFLVKTRALKKSDSLKKNWAFFSVGIIIEV